MYNVNAQMMTLLKMGVVRIKALQVPNEGPKPGEKIAGGTELVVQNERGFVGTFNSRQRKTFALTVEVKRCDDLHVVWTEGPAKTIKTLGDQTPNSTTATFVKRIPTSTTLSGEFVTKSNKNQGNGVWIISTANSQLQMWEVSIVTILAGGLSKYYLSLQKVYDATMYKYFNDSILIPPEQFPGYLDWLSLQLFLERMANFLAIKPGSEYQSELAKEPVALADNQAEVIWFNQAKGFGFARVSGEVTNPIFHRSQVLNQEFPAFQPGQIIRYDSLNRTPRGVQLMGVTE